MAETYAESLYKLELILVMLFQWLLCSLSFGIMQRKRQDTDKFGINFRSRVSGTNIYS